MMPCIRYLENRKGLKIIGEKKIREASATDITTPPPRKKTIFYLELLRCFACYWVIYNHTEGFGVYSFDNVAVPSQNL